MGLKLSFFLENSNIFLYLYHHLKYLLYSTPTDSTHELRPDFFTSLGSGKEINIYAVLPEYFKIARRPSFVF